jgi:short-chain fatty acids transporter
VIARLGLAISRLFRAIMPDPFVLAILLTFLVLALALLLTPNTPRQLLDAWAGDAGLWGLLRFAMQMALILVTGHAVASSPPVARLLLRLSDRPTTQRGAIVLVTLVACLTGMVNWGLGLIAGAIAAREVGTAMRRKRVRTHYPLLCASGYLSLMVFHGGLSASAPLKVTKARELADIFGGSAPIGPIPLDATLLSPLNLFVTGGLLVLLPLLMAALAPDDPARIVEAPAPAASPAPGVVTGFDEPKPGGLRLLEDTPLVSLLFVALIAGWAWRFYFPATGPSGARELTPDSLNLTMLMLGLLLHRTPANYVRAIEEAAAGCAGIILQFPIYAGIMGIMSASGLIGLASSAFGAIASADTLPLMTFFAACLVGLVVPSGGAQWAVQGPIAMQAAVDAGVPPVSMVMAIAYGDELANMLQPFWVLPLLAITRIRARDIVGYTALAMALGIAWASLGLLLF